jgi:hypothetical protein
MLGNANPYLLSLFRSPKANEALSSCAASGDCYSSASLPNFIFVGLALETTSQRFSQRKPPRPSKLPNRGAGDGRPLYWRTQKFGTVIRSDHWFKAGDAMIPLRWVFLEKPEEHSNRQKLGQE